VFWIFVLSEHLARRIQRCTVADSPLEPPVPAQAKFQLLNNNDNNLNNIKHNTNDSNNI